MALGIIEPKGLEPPPGTEYLIDTERTAIDHQPEHTLFKHGKGSTEDIVLIPQPSDNPNDPLLWPTWKRESAFWFLFFNSILFATCPGPIIAPSTVALSKQFHVSIKEISQLSGYQMLVVGALGPLVSVLAEKYGKRPQFIIACFAGVLGTAICIAGFDMAHLKRSYNILLAGRLVQGIGTTAFESIAIASIGDMFYLHQRGVRTSLLVLTTACLGSLVSIIAGPMFEAMGMRNMLIVLLPLQTVGLLGTFFLIPETQFLRNSFDARVVTSTEGQESEKAVRPTEVQIDPVTSNDVKKRTYKEDLRITSGVYDQTNIAKLLLRIFAHLLNPAIVWIMLVSAVLVSFFIGIAYTVAQTWSPPPYSLTVAQNGYFFIGALIGGLLGIGAGPLCDYVARVLALRNKGIFEPEFRIPLCGLSVIVFSIGYFTFMWALQHPLYPLHNTVYLCSFCYGLITFGTSVAGTSAGLYVLDAFAPYATSIFILQMMMKNFIFYSFSTFVNDYAKSHGPAYMLKVFGIVTLCGFTTCLPMYVFGKVNRAWVHRVHSKLLA